MSERKTEKLKNIVMKAQTEIAKLFGIPRIQAPKTEKMLEGIPPQLLNEYAEDFNKLVEWARTAKQIEDAAIEGELKNVARYARNCKIMIKDCCKKFIKNMNKADKDYTLDSAHINRATAEIKDLLKKLGTPIQNMAAIYNTAVSTYQKLSGNKDVQPITIDAQPSAPPQE